MPISATYAATLTTVETLTSNVPFAASNDKTVTHSGLNNTGVTLNASSNPAGTLCAYFQQALTAGAATIDLTALTGTNGASVSFNGLKVRAVLFRNPSGNANPITVGEGASDGYELFGDGFSITLSPGQEFLAYLGNGAPTVGSSAKEIDLAGTGSQALDVGLVAG